MFSPDLGLGAQPIALFAVGYAVCLATPGPIAIMIADCALWRGWRSTLPVCAGVTAGSVALAGLVFLVVELLPYAALMERAARGVNVVLLVYIAWRAFTTTLAVPPAAARRTDFALGCLTALLSPISGAFFVSYFLAHKGLLAPNDALAIVLIVVAVNTVRNVVVTVAFGMWPLDRTRTTVSRRVATVSGCLFLVFAALSASALVQ